MLDLEPHAEGVVLSIKAQPGARHSAIRGVHDGALRLAVTQVAEKGKANKALVDLLAAKLGLSRSSFEIIGGATSARKKVLVRGVSADELRRMLSVHLTEGED